MRTKLAVLFVVAFVISWGYGQTDNPLIGTWKLNVAKSKHDPGPVPKSQTSKIEASGSNGVKVTTDGVDGQGKPTHTEYTANYDEKDYPITGSPDYDTVAVRRINAYATLRIDKKGGKVVRMLRNVVAKDGKTRTVVSIGVNAQGQTFHNITFYDKQ